MKKKKVVFISENSQPCEEYSCPTINPNESAKYVLEIVGGLARKIGLTVGEKMSLEIK